VNSTRMQHYETDSIIWISHSNCGCNCTCIISIYF